MPSKWFKTTDCKTLHLSFSDFFKQPVTKIMGKTAIWKISCFYPFPLLTMLRNNEQNLRQAMLWVQNIP